MCRNLIDPYSNWSSLPYSQLESLGILGASETNNIRSIPLLTSITEMFLYIHGQVIIRAGVKLLSPGEGPEGKFCKHDGQSKENEPKEQGYENLWSFTQLSSSISIREAAMFVLRVLDNFLLHSH